MLSDQASMLTGSLGLLPSASLGAKNIDGNMRAMYEPIHGSAPDIAGKGIANPMAQMLTASMMLNHLGETEASKSIEQSVLRVIEDGNTLTADLGGKASTKEVGSAVIRNIIE